MSWWETGVEIYQQKIYIDWYRWNKFVIKYYDITNRFSAGVGDAIGMLSKTPKYLLSKKGFWNIVQIQNPNFILFIHINCSS